MLLFEFLFVLILTLTLTTIFAFGMRRHRTAAVLLPFFIMLFLMTWATGVWITPFGPVIGGFFWLPFVATGLIFVLLLTALIPPPRPPKSLREEARQNRKERETFLVLDVFFWLLIGALLLTLLVRYLSDVIS